MSGIIIYINLLENFNNSFKKINPYTYGPEKNR